MDPLSGAASIIAVITLSANILKFTTEYYHGWKDATTDISRLRKELIATQILLLKLENLKDTADKKALCCIDLLFQENGPLPTCRAELQRLEKKLSPSSDNTGPSFKQRLTWPLKSKEIDKTIEQLRRSRELFNLALNVDQMGIMMAIKNYVAGIEINYGLITDDIRAIKDTSETLQESQSHTEFIGWLDAPDEESSQREGIRRYQENTCEWFTKGTEIEKWKAQAGGFLWLHGIPGCGKTVLSSATIELMIKYCTERPGRACAYFYFDFTDPRKQSALDFLKSIVRQLCEDNGLLSKELQKYRLERYKSSSRPHFGLLEEMLKKCVNSNGLTDVFIVIDALDECPQFNSERRYLLELLGKMDSWNPSKLHILATSRTLEDIQFSVHSMVKLINVPIKMEFVDLDIRRHITQRLKDDRLLNKWTPKIKDEIKQKLSDGSQGMFRWVHCHLDSLTRCLSPKAIRVALVALPKDLNGTYERILAEIDDIYAETAQRALIWLCFSKRPLTLAEIAEAAIFDPLLELDAEDRLADPKDLLQILGSLVTVTRMKTPQLDPDLKITRQEESDCLQLAHFTVQEYLQSEALGKIQNESLRNFYLDSSLSSTNLGLACLKYLPTAGEVISKASTENELNEAFDAFPLWTYCEKYFLAHYYKDIPETRRAEMSTYLTALLMSDAGKELAYSTDSSAVLGYAADKGLVVQLKILLANQLDPNVPYLDYPALYYAVTFPDKKEAIKMADILLESGADPNIDYGNGTVLMNFLKEDDVDELSFDIIRKLVDAGADINVADKEDDYALLIALELGREDLVSLLLDLGADPNFAPGSTTSLLTALLYGNFQLIRMLLDRGASIDQICDTDNGTSQDSALHWIARNGTTEHLSMLLEYGPNVNLSINYLGVDCVPIQLVQDKEYNADIFNLLLKHGALLSTPFPENLRRKRSIIERESLFRRVMHESREEYESTYGPTDWGDLSVH